ncbi:MAG: DUF4097 domain-containing protein [Firmicutes bacterium]|nr:DUF4097 domain-containing protein [[Eubacterium] siraeum]MCM1488414.1 DUF4097 domain-containing protein [Bacillota bacterium]
MKKENVKYIVGGSMVGFGLLLVIISVCVGGWKMLVDFGGVNIDMDGIHYYYYDEENLQSGVNTMETAGIKNLDIDVDYGELVIKTADVEEIEINSKNVTDKRFNYKQNGDTLKITYGGGFSFFTWRGNSVITVTVPSNMTFDKVEIRNGAGSMGADGLTAKELKAENGAGELKLTDINVEDKLKIENGAGAVTMNGIDCGELKITSGVGEINAKDTVCTAIDVDNGIGAFSYAGEINGNAKVENGIGEVKMTLKGDSSDYGFDVDSGVGQVKVNGNSPIHYNNAKYEFKVDTGIGEVRINFE